MSVEDKIMDTPSVLANAVQRSAQGDREAFRVVFEAGNDKLFSYLLGQLQHREEALDILQETFVDIWRGLPNFRYRSDEEFWGFVFTIARRKVFASKKQADKKHVVATSNNDLDLFSENDTNANPYPEDHRLLLGALGKLGEVSREIIKLRYWSELSFKEIALAMRTSENAAKVRHHRAIKELQTHLPQHHVEQQLA
jgi:RNA polymerase sigma factor (sigma-70 family)